MLCLPPPFPLGPAFHTQCSGAVRPSKKFAPAPKVILTVSLSESLAHKRCSAESWGVGQPQHASVPLAEGWLELANHDRDPRLAAACFRAHLRLVQTAANAAVPSAHQVWHAGLLWNRLVWLGRQRLFYSSGSISLTVMAGLGLKTREPRLSSSEVRPVE